MYLVRSLSSKVLSFVLFFVVASLVALTSTAANADIRFGISIKEKRRPPVRSPRLQPPVRIIINPYPSESTRGYPDRREVYVGRYLRDETLQLDRLLNLGSQNYGDTIESVVVTLRDAGRGSLTLMMDYSNVDFRSNLYRVETLRPRGNARVGIDFRSLGLRIGDKVFVESVAVNLIHEAGYPDPGGNPGSFDLEEGVYQVYQGYGRLDVGQLVNLYQYQGYQVLSVEIIGGAVGYRGGQATLLANGFEQGRSYFSNQSAESQSIYMRSPSTVGRDLNSLVISVSGDMRIDRIRVRLAR